MTRKPRLLCLIQLPPPVHGASVMNQQVVTSEAVRDAFELEVLPLSFARSIDDITKFSVRKVGKALVTAVQLARTLGRHRPDAVYVTLSPAGGAFLRDCVFIAVIRAAGVPRVFHLHGKGIRQELSSRWRRALYRWAFEDAAVIQLSPLLASDLDELVDPGRLFFVPNGVPVSATPATRRSEARALRILYLSNMAEEKGPLVLLESLGMLAARGVEVEATFAGAPFGDCVARFTARLAELGLQDRVRYVGPQYGADKHRLFAEHDVFAFPTHYAREAFPLVILEAMQHGLPVVSTSEGAIAEMVIEGETGLRVPPRDPGALTAALEALSRDRGRARRMGEQGRVKFLERFTLPHFETALVDALERAVGSAGA